MSRKMKISVVAAAVVLAAAGTIVVGTGSGQASTAACGPSCTSPVNSADGTNVLTLTLTGSGKGCSSTTVTAASLTAAANYTSTCTLTVGMAAASTTNTGQDWLTMTDGDVPAFVSADALPTWLNIQDTADPVLEFEAAPDGTPTGLCLSLPDDSSELYLSTCGVSTDVSTASATGGSSTVDSTPEHSTTNSSGTTTSTTTVSCVTCWVLDKGNAGSGTGYDDLISGTSQNFSLPDVLTYSGGGVGIQPLDEIGGVVSPGQMWNFTYQEQSSLGIKQDGTMHT
jgi:hypothetical protein